MITLVGREMEFDIVRVFNQNHYDGYGLTQIPAESMNTQNRKTIRGI